jgi:hypothetical protein
MPDARLVFIAVMFALSLLNMGQVSAQQRAAHAANVQAVATP